MPAQRTSHGNRRRHLTLVRPMVPAAVQAPAEPLMAPEAFRLAEMFRKVASRADTAHPDTLAAVWFELDELTRGPLTVAALDNTLAAIGTLLEEMTG